MKKIPSKHTSRTRWGKASRDIHESRVLSGPHSRFEEFFQLVRIMLDYINGLRALHFMGPCVTVFGSARFGEGHPYYPLAREVGKRMARLGFTVMTGGGPGLMEAANRGAKEGGGRSIGCNIQLPKEQSPNPYVDRWVEFRYFFIRKLMLAKYSYAFLVMPGGYGTADEFFEMATLIQTGKVKQFPLILMDKSYWAPLVAMFKNSMLRQGAIDEKDLDLLYLCDSPEEAANYVRRHTFKQFGLRYKRVLKPLPIFGEG